jgi:hypothetical protein
MVNRLADDDRARWAAIFTAECGFFSAASLQRLFLRSFQVYTEETVIVGEVPSPFINDDSSDLQAEPLRCLQRTNPG